MSNSKRCPFCKEWIPLPIREADRAFERHKKACDPEGYAKQRAFVKELLGGDSTMDEETIPTLDEDGNPIQSEPAEPKAKRGRKAAEPKAPKPAKEPKAPKPSKFTGTYTKEQAEQVVVAEAAKETPDFGKSRTWTVIVGGQTVAPKWLTEQLTGVKAGEFSTSDAVKLLTDIGLTPVFSGTVAS